MAQAVKGIYALTQKLNGLKAEIREEAEQNLVKWGAQLFAREARKKVPVKTGNLRKSIRLLKATPGLLRRSGFGLVKKDWILGEGIIRYIVAPTRGGKGKADGFYAHMVEFGTKAHEIKPKRKKALHYNDRFASAVMHPGFDAKPFMRPAFDENADAAIHQMGVRLGKWLKRKGSTK